MTRRPYFPYVFATIVLFILPKIWAAAGDPNTRATNANSHASLSAYPNAIVSLKDPKTGNLYYVESNGRRLVAFDKAGAVTWNVDVIEALPEMPLICEPVIRHLKLDRGHVTVTIAKHAYVEVQTDSGKCKYLGAD